jgi:BirA family transcriptional regulator, biotin operon repressor / biotin---[acetyl-CoA-carboxylase] ligase
MTLAPVSPPASPPAVASQPSFFGSAETIWQAVMAMGLPSLAGFSVEVLPEIDSTNTELMRRARAGHTEPTLLVAEQQNAGRGRLGRHWASDPGSSLTFSLGVLLQPQAWDGLSLAVGLSVASSLHESIQLKWPNDLWVRGCKLAGILIETAAAPGNTGPRYAVIGIGINIAPRPAEGLSTPPASLQALMPQASAEWALESVVAPLVRGVLQFEQGGFAPLAARFAARDALHGQEVHLSDGICGTAQGVDARGALLVRTAQGVRRITSSEVSVRPVPYGL